MTLDPDETTATRVLTQRHAALQPEIDEAASRCLEAHHALIELMKKDDALRQAIHVIAGQPIEVEPHLPYRLIRLRGRLESLADDLQTIKRLAQKRRSHRPRRAGPPPQFAHRGSPVTDEPFGSREPAPPRVPLAGRALAVESEAIKLARRAGGTVRVRDLAEHINERDPERFASLRSAYASISAQLDRSSQFIKGDRGEFLLVDDQLIRLGSSEGIDGLKGGPAE